jgi:hypothetical protein
MTDYYSTVEETVHFPYIQPVIEKKTNGNLNKMRAKKYSILSHGTLWKAGLAILCYYQIVAHIGFYNFVYTIYISSTSRTLRRGLHFSF